MVLTNICGTSVALIKCRVCGAVIILCDLSEMTSLEWSRCGLRLTLSLILMTNTEIRKHWLTWSAFPAVFPRGTFVLRCDVMDYGRTLCTVVFVLQVLRGGLRPPTKSDFSGVLLGSLGWTSAMWSDLSKRRTKYHSHAWHFQRWPRWFWALWIR